MKLLVYRDNDGFVFGPVENKEEIEKAVKLQEWFIDDQPDLVEQFGKYKLVGEVEGNVFYAWVKDKIAFIESDKSKVETNGYSATEVRIANKRPPIVKVYKFLGMTFTVTWRS